MERNNQASAILCALIAVSSTQLMTGCKQSSGGGSNAPAADAATAAPAMPAPTTPGQTAATAAPPSAPPPTASPADPRDAQLAAFAHEVADAILNAAKGSPVDPKWLAHDPAGSVATVTPDAHRLLAELGPSPTVVIAELELDEIARPAAGEHHQVMAHAVLLPDNTIRWSTVATRHGESELVDPTPGLETEAPALASAAARAIEGMRANCTLPWLAESDISAVPANIRSEFVTDMGVTHAACTAVQGVHGDWRPHVDDIRVLVTGNGHFGFLNSMFDVEGAGTDGGGHLVLRPFQVDLVHEGSAAGAADAAAPAAAH